MAELTPAQEKVRQEAYEMTRLAGSRAGMLQERNHPQAMSYLDQYTKLLNDIMRKDAANRDAWYSIDSYDAEKQRAVILFNRTNAEVGRMTEEEQRIAQAVAEAKREVPQIESTVDAAVDEFQRSVKETAEGYGGIFSGLGKLFSPTGLKLIGGAAALYFGSKMVGNVRK